MPLTAALRQTVLHCHLTREVVLYKNQQIALVGLAADSCFSELFIGNLCSSLYGVFQPFDSRAHISVSEMARESGSPASTARTTPLLFAFAAKEDKIRLTVLFSQ